MHLISLLHILFIVFLLQWPHCTIWQKVDGYNHSKKPDKFL